MPDTKSIGSKIKKLRKQAGFTQTQAAEFLSIDQSLLSKIERGERSVSAKKLECLSKLFRCPLSAFLDDSDDTIRLKNQYPNVSLCDYNIGNVPSSLKAAAYLNENFLNIADFIGEATEYDKKRSVERTKVKNWLKSVSAFANTFGGTLIFGIADNDEIIGLENVKSDSEFISQKIKERISPFPHIMMKIHRTENGRGVLLLRVPAGDETPYYYTGDGSKEAYIRIGNESVPADATELKRLVLHGRNSSYDSLISPYDYKDFSFSKVRERYRRWTGNSMADSNFESFDIRDAQGRLTMAGALLADDSPISWSRLSCTRWNGLNKSGGKTDAADSAEYTGSLIILLNEGMRFVKRNMKKLWGKTADSRIEMPDYCERSVFEALVNALIHRDYLINGSEVHIDIFDDRLVIYSPGGMPDGTQIQERDIEYIPSRRRNPVLADIFTRLGYMESQGSGLSKIRLSYQNAANYGPRMKPVFRSNRVEFTVTLKNLNYKASKNEAMELKTAS